jgi:hypothetical protein
MKSYSCKSCSSLFTSKLNTPYLIVCPKCNAIVFQHPSIDRAIPASRVPDDWSFVQIGTGFVSNEQKYEVCGRIRLQLRNDYKNFWCGVSSAGEHVWLAESFASFAVLGARWTDFDRAVTDLHAGHVVQLKGGIKLRGDYVEKCEAISYEGEIGEWKVINDNVYFIQCSSNDNNTAFFLVAPHREIDYLLGVKATVENLKLENILAWDEWK